MYVNLPFILNKKYNLLLIYKSLAFQINSSTLKLMATQIPDILDWWVAVVVDAIS